ncbi:MAG: hypothetical protein RLZZ127_88 [Planctomycetota bacterium]|jgi:nucleoid-associated protein YgaU
MSRDILWAGIAVGVLTVVVAIAFLVPGQKPAEPTPPPIADAGLTPSDPFAAPPVADPFAFPPVSATPAPLPPALPPFVDPAPLPGPGPVVSDPFAPIGPSPLATPPAPMADAAPAPTGKTHTVVKGDLLGDISRKYYGTSRHWKLIAEANPGANPDNLKVGTVLTIPPAPGAAPKAVAAPQAGEGTYVVQKGDSYHTIAKKVLGSTARWKELETLNGIPPGELKIGQTLRIPGGGAAATPGSDALAPAPGAPAAGGRTHTVAKGEYLSDISKKYYGTTRQWQKIAAANPGVNPNNLKVGTVLTIPDAESAAAPAPGGAAPAPAAGGKTYTVAKGDTGGDIARKTLGSARRWSEIAAANPGVNANNLKIGQVLQIPGGAAPAAAPAVDLGAPAPGGTPVPSVPVAEPPFKDPFLELGLPPAPGEPTSPAGTPAPPTADPFRL